MVPAFKDKLSRWSHKTSLEVNHSCAHSLIKILHMESIDYARDKDIEDKK